MNSPVIRLFTLLALQIFFVPAQAADTSPATGVAYTTSQDNENFSMQRIALEYLPAYTQADSYTGLRYTEHHYEQNTWSRNGRQLSLLHRNIDPASANGLHIETGIFSQNGHDLLTADASFRAMPTATTGLEIFVNRDWVETSAALDTGVHFTFGGLAVDHMLTPKITLAGVAGIQNFSDDNFRNHGRAKLIYQPDPDLGLTLQLRYRAYTSSSSTVGNAYFNPYQYDETMLALGWRQRISGWMGNLTAGTGQQKVASDPPTPTLLLELGLHSPAWHRRYALRLRATMSQSASFNGPDYRYSFVHGEWIIAL